MLNSGRDPQTNENTNAEQHETTTDEQVSIPQIRIVDPDQQTRTLDSSSSSGSETETEMSSSHRSSSSASKGKQSSKHKSKKDDWSEITDPEERRRVQNRIAQRKFRDKAKETKERQERDADNRAHAHQVYDTPDPQSMEDDDNLSGLPWGSLSLKHVISRGKAKESESRRGSNSRSHEAQSSFQHSPSQPVYEDPDQDGYYEDSNVYDAEDRAYYDYASGSGSYGGSSR